MAIDRNFINKLPNNILLAEQRIVDAFYQTMEIHTMAQDKTEFYNDFLDLFSFYQVYAEKHALDVSFPKLTANPEGNLEIIISFFRNRYRIISKKVKKYASEKIVEEKKSKFEAMLHGEDYYKFTTEELKELKINLQFLKNTLKTSEYLDHKYVKRLIKRVDGILKELRAEMPNLDQLWGLTGEAGILVGRGKEKADLLVIKIKEILKIVWEAQARAEELSDDTPTIDLRYKKKEKKDKDKLDY